MFETGYEEAVRSVCDSIEDYECDGENILIERIEQQDELTAGGLVKPNVARLRSNKGTIVALGEGRFMGNQFIPFTHQIGQTVFFSRYGGTEVPIGDKTYLLVHWRQVYLRRKCADPQNA